MSVLISDSVLHAARITPEEFKQEVAVLFFAKEKLTLGQASQLAEMDQLSFQHLLASRHIPVHYDMADLEEDLKTLRKMGRI
ncbi:MAG: UPF0175 family protein [Candidatus Sumerlaeota bacterium]|nr:UPF0175 family protein [Candidatus Sumerlaeota bacterium]